MYNETSETTPFKIYNVLLFYYKNHWYMWAPTISKKVPILIALTWYSSWDSRDDLSPFFLNGPVSDWNSWSLWSADCCGWWEEDGSNPLEGYCAISVAGFPSREWDGKSALEVDEEVLLNVEDLLGSVL